MGNLTVAEEDARLKDGCEKLGVKWFTMHHQVRVNVPGDEATVVKCCLVKVLVDVRLSD